MDVCSPKNAEIAQILFIFFHFALFIIKSVFTALQHQQIKRYIVSCRSFIEAFKQAFGKSDCSGNVCIAKLIIHFKHNITSVYNIMSKMS